MSEVKATYTKDIHYSGIITVDGETVVSMDANMDAKHPDVPIINRYINNGRKYRSDRKLSRAGNGPAFLNQEERETVQ